MPETKILVVEDEAITAQHIGNYLKALGYIVTAQVSSGETAIEQAVQTQPDLVLMDITLKGTIDGVQAAQTIGKRFDIPVVYLTAHSDEATLQQAKITEPFGYILKPFEERELCITVEMALRAHMLKKQLRENETRYRAISELVSDFAYAVHIGPDGLPEIEWVTESFYRVFGFALEEMQTGVASMRLVHPEDMPQVSRAIQLLLTGKQPVELELRLIAKSGETYWVRNYSRAEWDETQSRVVRILGAAQNITKRKQAELSGEIALAALQESEQKLKLITESTTDTIMAYDMQRRLIYANPAVETLTGYSLTELYERQFINWLHPEDEAKMLTWWDRLFEGDSYGDEEFRIITKTGQIKWCSGSWGPLYDEDGQQVGIRGSEHDITSRKQAEAQREAALAALQESERQAQALAHEKTELLREVNHRVSNNLLLLQGVVNMELDRVQHTEACAVLADIKDRLRCMSDVHRLLEQTQWKPLRLDMLVERVVRGALSGSPIRGAVQIVSDLPDEPVWIRSGQAIKLALILNELTTNSVKYAFRERGEGSIEVKAKIEDKDKEKLHVELEYSDDGPGWPADVLSGERENVGLRLVQITIRHDLHGKVELRNENGAVIKCALVLDAAG